MIRRPMSALGLVLLVNAAGLAAERPAGVRLVEVTSESTAASQSVLITTTEPASYTALQPDPLTVDHAPGRGGRRRDQPAASGARWSGWRG